MAEQSSFQTMIDEVDAQTLQRVGAPQNHPDFDQLVRTIWRLRQSDGCPWDKVQTHRSIAQNMIEETYEAVDAIMADDVPHLREELGDMLEQVLLNTQIASDDGEFTLDDVCHDLNEKLIRRHPHVFGDLSAESAELALERWDEVKKQERAARGAAGEEEPGLLDSVPLSLPALMQCQKISKRAAKAGFEWDTIDNIWEKVAEERAEFEREARGTEAATEEFGDMLFALVNVARREGVDAEEALAASNRKFRRRWSTMERMAREQGRDLESFSTEELNVLWDQIKASEHAAAGAEAAKECEHHG